MPILVLFVVDGDDDIFDDVMDMFVQHLSCDTSYIVTLE
jgi:hypothetical protein